MPIKQLKDAWFKTLDKAALRLLIANAQKKWLQNPIYPNLMLCQELRDHYNELDGSLFFKPPQKQEPTVLDDGTLKIESHYCPSLKRLVAPYAAYKENYTLRFRLLRPESPPRATLFCIHGWQGGDIDLDVKYFRASQFLKNGFSLCFIELPFHGQRKTPNKPTPFPSTSLAWTNEAMAQSIHDLRVIRRWVETKSSAPTGLIGISLGGYIASLWATLDSFEFVGALCPAVDLATLIWSHDRNSINQRKARTNGVTEKEFKDVFAQHSPLARALKVPSGARAIVAGSADHITPPEQAMTLAKHWDTPLTTIEGGHVSFVTNDKPWELILKNARSWLC